jgi:Na+/glutamate symporter
MLYLLLGLGHLLCSKIELLQRLYLLSCVAAGITGLITTQFFYFLQDKSGLLYSANRPGQC